jgi:hypothetical protein
MTKIIMRSVPDVNKFTLYWTQKHEIRQKKKPKKQIEEQDAAELYRFTEPLK